jgi:hypothetical protein
MLGRGSRAAVYWDKRVGALEVAESTCHGGGTVATKSSRSGSEGWWAPSTGSIGECARTPRPPDPVLALDRRPSLVYAAAKSCAMGAERSRSLELCGRDPPPRPGM